MKFMIEADKAVMNELQKKTGLDMKGNGAKDSFFSSLL